MTTAATSTMSKGHMIMTNNATAAGTPTSKYNYYDMEATVAKLRRLTKAAMARLATSCRLAVTPMRG